MNTASLVITHLSLFSTFGFSLGNWNDQQSFSFSLPLHKASTVGAYKCTIPSPWIVAHLLHIHCIQIQVVPEIIRFKKWQPLLLGWLRLCSQVNFCVLVFHNPRLNYPSHQLGLLSQLLPAFTSFRLSSPESNLRKTSKPYLRKKILAAHQESLDNSMRLHLILATCLT